MFVAKIYTCNKGNEKAPFMQARQFPWYKIRRKSVHVGTQIPKSATDAGPYWIVEEGIAPYLSHHGRWRDVLLLQLSCICSITHNSLHRMWCAVTIFMCLQFRSRLPGCHITWVATLPTTYGCKFWIDFARLFAHCSISLHMAVQCRKLTDTAPCRAYFAGLINVMLHVDLAQMRN